MARKSKRQREEEEHFEAHKQTIYQAAKECNRFLNYEEDKLFALLVVCGYPAAHAYRIAYPGSRANSASSAVLASRRLSEPSIQRFLQMFLNYYWQGLITLNTSCLKTKQRRWPKWLGKQYNRIDPA